MRGDQAASLHDDLVDHTLRLTVELLVRLGRPDAAAVVLGGIEARDAANVYGADAERLARLRADLERRLGTSAAASIGKGAAMAPVELVAFARSRLTE